MKPNNYTGILLEQYTGKEIIAESLCPCKSKNEAQQLYIQSKERLLDVDHWKDLLGLISADFCVMDPNGIATGKPVTKGNLLRVDIPGPGSSSGDGYDWVMVEALEEFEEEDIQSIAFRVRPTFNPKGATENIAHFYDHEATSTFIVTRNSNTVYSTIVDRNIKPNTDTNSIVDTLRNMPVAIGAIGLLSKLQWKSLAEGLLTSEP